MIPVIYQELCPQCGEDLSWFEIERDLCQKKKKKLSYTSLSWEYRKFEEFFRGVMGAEPRALQRMWARRILASHSFAAIAPTGIGKTSFGLIMALYLAQKGKRSYLIFPTTILLQEALEKIKKWGGEELVAYYHGNMKKREKEEYGEKIKKGNFRILLTTSAFLSRNFSMISSQIFRFIFVDDVDSVLKKSRNIEKLISLVLRGKGVLMVSTATGSRGYNTKLLREKLNFDVGNIQNAVRNVVDITASKESLERILKEMGAGGLIFTPTAEEAEKLMEKLKNFRVGLVVSQNKEAYERFKKGEVDYLVGVATPYGSLIRGIDLPERIKFAVFYGMPSFRVGAEDIDSLSERLLIILAYLLGDEDLRKLANAKDIQKIRERIKTLFRERKIVEGEGFLYREGKIIFPDIRTYIQGSGRTSRLYLGGITKGASFLLDDEKNLEVFKKRASLYDIEFVSLEEVNLEKLRKEIEEDRKRLQMRAKGEEVIKPILFIVESPNKAKHIAHFFGKPNIRALGNAIIYEVATQRNVLLIAPSLGHMVDLVTRRGFHGVLVKDSFVPIYSPLRKCRNCNYQFTEGDKCPICGSQDIYFAKEQIEVLRQLAFECEKVLIGTDPDMEGEKIAWDLKNLLKPFAREIKRAEFHEVTKKAILSAIENERELNEDLVKAQLVRRIEDRWIGFELSQILWRKYGERNLSAGRAQTPVLGWIIERFRESKKKREAWFIKGTSVRVPWQGEVLGEIELVTHEEKDYAIPPYTTDEILKDANRILGMGARETMALLQQLFEKGLITYHRTDSTHVSDMGLKIARNYLGEDFRARKWGTEGAHECIRPTRAWDAQELRRYINEGVLPITLEEKELKLYDLIFRRFMASETHGKMRISRYRIKAQSDVLEFSLITNAKGPAYQLFPYNLKIYPPLPTGKRKIELEKRIVAVRPYTQADVIRLMKERRIGRPSTYATILGKLFQRKYIKEIRGELIPSNRGMEVYEFLASKYGKFISEERTRLLEEKMDMVERGEKNYEEVLKELYEEISELRVFRS